MTEYNLITSFFKDQDDYISFLVRLKLRVISNDDNTCHAELKKVNGSFLYTLTWFKDGYYIGDYVKPFRATQDNIDTFNKGCKILAERLALYIETENQDIVPSEPPAFGELTKEIV